MIKKVEPLSQEQTGADVAMAATKAIAGAVPILGPLFNEALELGFGDLLHRRQKNWQDRVTKAVNDLIAKEISIASLAKDEYFLTVVASLTRTAHLTLRNEKMELLGSVVYTAGTGKHVDDLLRSTFLQLVDRYTPEHVALLKELDNPSSLKNALLRLKAQEAATGKKDDKPDNAQIEHIVPHLIAGADKEVAMEIFRDLGADLLVNRSEGWTYDWGSKKFEPVTTARGQEFLCFLGV